MVNSSSIEIGKSEACAARITLGSTETVALPSICVNSVTAKIDTGAWSGALHCTHIKEANGELSFWPLGEKKLAVKTSDYATRIVRSTSGHKMRRYVIPMTIAMRGKKFETSIGLSNRQLMRREMLIGRKFLLENDMLVDVSLTIDNDRAAEFDL